jgi:hypothetical protein
VNAHPAGGWILGNDTERLLAAVPAGEIQALRTGLEHYYRRSFYQLNVMLLNCSAGGSIEYLSIWDCDPERGGHDRLHKEQGGSGWLWHSRLLDRWAMGAMDE